MRISAVLARFKADFGLFRSPTDMAQFDPNRSRIGTNRAESARIREKKKKKLKHGTDARATASDVASFIGLECGTLLATSVLSKQGDGKERLKPLREREIVEG